jgi:hypothetical protein
LEQQRQRSHASVALPTLLELGVQRTLPRLTNPRHPRRCDEEHQQKPREPARLKVDISSRARTSAVNGSFQEKRRFFFTCNQRWCGPPWPVHRRRRRWIRRTCAEPRVPRWRCPPPAPTPRGSRCRRVDPLGRPLRPGGDANTTGTNWQPSCLLDRYALEEHAPEAGRAGCCLLLCYSWMF